MLSNILSAPLDMMVLVTNLRKAGSGRGSFGKALALSTMFHPARLSWWFEKLSWGGFNRRLVRLICNNKIHQNIFTIHLIINPFYSSLWGFKCIKMIVIIVIKWDPGEDYWNFIDSVFVGFKHFKSIGCLKIFSREYPSGLRLIHSSNFQLVIAC